MPENGQIIRPTPPINAGGRTTYSGISKALRRQLEQMIPDQMCDDLRERYPGLVETFSDRPTWAELVAFTLVDRALTAKGITQIAAIRELMDRAEGKPAQVVVNVSEPLTEKTDEELEAEIARFSTGK